MANPTDPPRLLKLYQRNGFRYAASPREWFVNLLDEEGVKGVANDLVVSQATIYRWIAEYGIEFETKVKR